ARIRECTFRIMAACARYRPVRREYRVEKEPFAQFDFPLVQGIKIGYRHRRKRRWHPEANFVGVVWRREVATGENEQ
ncbi:MAG: hypothetical protein R2834_21915, partial [Rhodothermales bacterium]